MHRLRFLFLVLTCLCLMDRVFPDEVKTIDGDIITGAVVGVDEEYLSIGYNGDNICFIQWRIISLISRDKEVIIVNHDETQKKFSILKTANNLSVKNMNLTTTDKISDIYPQEKITRYPLFEGGVKQLAQTGTANPTIPDTKIMRQSEPLGTSTVSFGTKVASEPSSSSPPKTWKGHVDAGLNIKNGNTESTSTTLKGGYTSERMRDNIYLDAIVLYELVTNKDTKLNNETINEQRVIAKYEYKNTLRWYSLFNQYFEHDEIEHLNYRLISSPGIGYRFILSEKLNYKVEGGPAYTREVFHGGIIAETLGTRIGQYLDWKIFPMTALYAKLEYLQSIENRDDWQLYSKMGIKHSITKTISLNLEMLDQYDNTPGPGKEKDDRIVIGTLGYNF